MNEKKETENDDSNDEVEDDEDSPEIMRFKWLADGCTTWNGVIERLRERIREVEALRDKDARILEEVNDDYLFYTVP